MRIIVENDPVRLNARSTRLIRRWPLVLWVIALLIYVTGISAPYYADDFQFVFESPGSKIIYFLTHPNPYNGFFRPLQASVLAAVQSVFGWQTWPIHLLQITLHALLSWLVFTAMRRLGTSRLQAMLGSLFMLVSQISVYAVLGNDTLSQVGGTLCGYGSLWLLHKAFTDVSIPAGGTRINWRYYLGSLGAFALALYSKETSGGFVALLIGLVFLHSRKGLVEERRYASVVLAAIPFVLVFSLYVLVRHEMGLAMPRIGGEPTDFKLGLNVVINIAQTVFASLLPVSTVRGFVAFATQDSFTMLLCIAATVLIAALAMYGLWLSKRVGLILILTVYALVTMFPAVTLNHISELYAYNALPPIAALLSMGLGRLIEIARERRTYVLTVMGFIGIMMLAHIIAVQEKITLMRDNGERAVRMLAQIEPLLQAIPRQGTLVLVNPLETQPFYSVFRVYGFKLFQYGESIFTVMSGRHDFTTVLLEQEDFKKRLITEKDLVLGLQTDSVYIYHHVGAEP